MTTRATAGRTTRRVPGVLVAGPLVVLAGIIGALSFRSTASSSSRDVVPVLPSRVVAPILPSTTASSADVLPTENNAALGEADGVVPDGTTVFDEKVPAVAKLDRALLGALRHAATDAAGARVSFYVESGWRSPAYQAQLLREAVSKYGSAEVAARWVVTPATSPHVSGNAVDIGPSDAAAWLSRHGAAYGMCQIYRNEPWHYELRPTAVAQGCPTMYADPTHDPRMQQ